MSVRQQNIPPQPFRRGQRELSARVMNMLARAAARVSESGDPSAPWNKEPIQVGILQEAIEANASGDVKLGYYNADSPSIVAHGNAFAAWNVGPDDADEDAIVLLRMDGLMPIFQHGAGAAAAPSGEIVMYGGSTAPSGWLLCDGSAVSRTTYTDLFAVIGTTFGVGDGSTTFNVPDFRRRYPVGVYGTGANTPNLGDDEGDTVGNREWNAHSHTLLNFRTDDEGPHTHVVHGGGASTQAAGAHYHVLNEGTDIGAGTDYQNQTNTESDHVHGIAQSVTSAPTYTESAGETHNHGAGADEYGSTDELGDWPPHLAVHFIIKA